MARKPPSLPGKLVCDLFNWSWPPIQAEANEDTRLWALRHVVDEMILDDYDDFMVA